MIQHMRTFEVQSQGNRFGLDVMCLERFGHCFADLLRAAIPLQCERDQARTCTAERCADGARLLCRLVTSFMPGTRLMR